MRVRLDLGYDGTDFHGWASQPSLRTVQGTLDASLAMLLRVESVTTTCAGRTDAGVHARGQVVHVDVDLETGVERLEDLLRRLNAVLPADIRVRAVREAPYGFDARFSAVWRRYVYRIADRPGAVDPLTRHSVLAWPRPLDLDAMSAAAPGLVGEHDFAAFCKLREGATTIREVQSLRWARDPAGVVEGTIVADAFCHHMVRALMGAFVAVGEGRREPPWVAEVLQGGVRDPAVTVLPAPGLTLEEVGYPADEELEARASSVRRLRVRRDG